MDNKYAALRPTLEVVYCEHLLVNAYVSPSSDLTSPNAGAQLSVNNGVPPYTYLWSNGATTKDIYNIAPGLHQVIITDARGLSTNVMVPVTSECGVVTFCVSANTTTQGAYKSVNIISDPSNENKANDNIARPSGLTAYKTLSGADQIAVGRSLLAFDLKALPNNMQVSNASLILANTQAPYGSPFTLQLARATSDWDERTSTFNTKPGYEPGDTVEFAYDASQSIYNIDVTGQMQTMLGNVSSSNGWFLKLKDESNNSINNIAGFDNGGASTPPVLAFHVTYANPACDDHLLNWNQEDAFDEYGNIIGSQKNYLDKPGALYATVG